MKFTKKFIEDNEELFLNVLEAEQLDYMSFYPVGDDFAIAETWEETNKSVLFIEL